MLLFLVSKARIYERVRHIYKSQTFHIAQLGTYGLLGLFGLLELSELLGLLELLVHLAYINGVCSDEQTPTRVS
jgi:hypothetical protein